MPLAESYIKMTINDATKTAVAEIILEEILNRLNFTPEFGVAGLNAAEARVELPKDVKAYITVSVQTDDQRRTVLSSAIRNDKLNEAIKKYLAMVDHGYEVSDSAIADARREVEALLTY